MSDFWYLATPYSKYKDGLEAAFLLAVRQRGLLLEAGVPSFSPIIHSHPVAMECGLDPLDHSIWLPSEKPLLDAAFGLVVVMADGWQESYGIRKEMQEFIVTHRPIVFMEPGMVPKELVKQGES